MEQGTQALRDEEDNPHVVVGYEDPLLVRFLVLKLVHYGITFMVRPAGEVAKDLSPDRDAATAWEVIVRKNDLELIREIIEVSYFKG